MLRTINQFQKVSFFKRYLSRFYNLYSSTISVQTSENLIYLLNLTTVIKKINLSITRTSERRPLYMVIIPRSKLHTKRNIFSKPYFLLYVLYKAPFFTLKVFFQYLCFNSKFVPNRFKLFYELFVWLCTIIFFSSLFLRHIHFQYSYSYFAHGEIKHLLCVCIKRIIEWVFFFFWNKRPALLASLNPSKMEILKTRFKRAESENYWSH